MDWRFIFGLWASMAFTEATLRFSAGCLVEEKAALLSFKASINETQNAHLLLSSWIDEDDEDCCNWERIKCSNLTGRVIGLSLRDLRNNVSTSSGTEHRNWFLNITTFLPLKELQALDLSSNYFQTQIQGCGQLSRLENLEFLYLDGNYFNNSMIPCLGAISTLKELSLVGNNLNGLFPIQELSRLSNIEILNLCGNNLTKVSSIEDMDSLKALSLRRNGLKDSSIFQGVCKLKNLLELDLSENEFSGSLPLCLGNLTSLRVLDLSANNFSGNIPSLLISKLIYLEYLSLSNNHFDGTFSFSSLASHSKLEVFKLVPFGNRLQVDTEHPPWLPPFQLKVLYLANCNLNVQTGTMPSFLLYQNELRAFDLSHNKLVGNFPSWILENNTNLEIVHLMNNSFTGPFQLHGDLIPHLVRLDISNNEINGQLPENTGFVFPNLRYLNLSRNFFEGNIPPSLGNMTASWSFDLSNNKFSGEAPSQIFTGCVSLQILKLSNNSLQGHLLPRYMNLTKLRFLYLDNNYFDGNIQDGLSNSPNLYLLDIANNEISGELPSWIGDFSALRTLVMAENSLRGTVPDDLCRLEMLSFLDLSQNYFSGSLPSCFNLSSLRFMHLQKNNLTGRIPTSLSRSSNLVTLDLRNNKFLGSIPNWIGEITCLKVLLLGGNQLQGEIPKQVCQLKKLSIVDLSNNSFSGPIPSCFGNLSFGRGGFNEDAFLNEAKVSWLTKFLETYEYKNYLNVDLFFTETFTASDEQEEVEFTTKSRANFYVGNILNFMSGLDVSCNQLEGEIPLELGELSEIRALNLSHNRLNGSIPERFSNLKQIESLDLSHNSLSGEIPSQLTDLNYLAIFNVSYNNLSGRTPDKGQFANFDESNYGGNLGLCWQLLNKSCSSAEPTTPPPPSSGGKDGSFIDMVAYRWSFVASYVSIFLGLLTILCINPYWRKAWFRLIDSWILSRFRQW